MPLKTIPVGTDSTSWFNCNQTIPQIRQLLLHWACQEKKKSLGYAVSEISGDNINTVKDHNIASSLTGKIAGVNITQSGSIGSGSRITIRGNNSIGGNTQALIVVDGVPIRKKKDQS